MDTLTAIQNYFEQLCTQHVDLLHNVDNRRAFARFKTDAHILQITRNATANIVVIAEINGQAIGHQDDGEVRRGVSILFASRAATSGSAEAAITAANEKAEEIMFQFIARMKVDQGDSCDLNFDLEQIAWNDIEGPWLENYYGWLLFLPFRGNLPAYEPEKWNED